MGPGFPKSPFLVYKDRQQRDSSAGMNCTQVIFPGWSIGMESSPQERKAALDTVTLAAEWYDVNNDCTFYPCAAAAGYDPKEILENLHALFETTQEPNFMIKTHGGGTEDDAIVPCCLAYMFLQSYQENIHLFPNWPMDQDASFGNLTACGGFLISSAVTAGKDTLRASGESGRGRVPVGESLAGQFRSISRQRGACGFSRRRDPEVPDSSRTKLRAPPG